ncbi:MULTISPECIES: linear amide C-N hydrolase [unclassified Shewanella]|uniref:linear amide C-N hydrolase n=1 Tax=unclassified Shewanella TaxID=196818 RepID=UPI001BC6AF82|nr:MULTISPECIES: linear amide C-N hydrolase [unclassified Shewanella]GIU05666.1 hypothetical protein TUM4444_02380 [Shewanella sp. MBTL60-112-B1]GIU25958.1 hypothetical protein TUM4445_04740 [Shewanella sp. MBTL60-112-B2]
MCLRVLNNLNREYPITGRNLNWEKPVEVTIFDFPSGLNKKGLSDIKARELCLDPKVVFKWCSKYASVVSMIGQEKKGFVPIDGMNSAGLVVNVLFNTSSTYGKPKPFLKNSNLSVLRCSQYILDMFKSVFDVCSYFKTSNLQLIKEDLTSVFFEEESKDKYLKSRVSLSISDYTGQSAVIEIIKGNLKLHISDEHQVVINGHNYDDQLNMLRCWKYLWGHSIPEVKIPMYTVSGGISPTHSFERAAFLLKTSTAALTPERILAQTRFIMQSGSIPLLNNSMVNEKEFCTRLTFLSNHIAGIYYLFNPMNVMPIWLTFSRDVKTCSKLKLINVSNRLEGVNNHAELQGDVQFNLCQTIDPFESRT